MVDTNRKTMLELLLRALEIEMAFESDSSWKAYLGCLENERSERLLQLVGDSERHRGTVENMISAIGGKEKVRQLQAVPRSFNLEGKNDLDVMLEIQKYDREAFEVYTALRKLLDKADEEMRRSFGDVSSFSSILSKLIEEEKGHLAILSKDIGLIERIR